MTTTAIAEASPAVAIRQLLTDGNEKLGKGIGVWSIPAVDTCPGKTSLCAAKCYADRFIRQYKIDYEPRLELAQSDMFVDRMVSEAQWRTLVRVHVAGDFFDAVYVRKWAEVARRCPRTQFYAYTRSWRRPELLPALRALAALPNFRLLWSADKETGVPAELADNVAYMSVNDEDAPPVKVKMVFRVTRKTRMAKMNGSTVCPKENGVKNIVTCGTCRLCFK